MRKRGSAGRGGRERDSASLDDATLAKIVASLGDAVVVCDGAFAIRYVNPAFETMYGYAPREVIGRDASTLAGKDVPRAQISGIKETLARGGIWRGRMRQRRKDGSHFTIDVCVFTVADADPSQCRYCSVNREVVAAKANENRKLHLARLSEACSLTPREREVLDLLLLGRSAREIGEALGIRPRTAKFHTTNVLHKLGAESRQDLLRVLWQT